MRKILLIEDEEDQVMMVKTRMEFSGYAFSAALDGAQGVQKALDERPDLILLDVVMPKLNGYEVCARLKSDPRTKDIPVIILTASVSKEGEEKYTTCGVKEVIRKPYESSYLVERVAAYLEGTPS